MHASKILAIILAVILTILIYSAIFFGVRLSYSIVYAFVTKPLRFLDFGRTIYLYIEYMLPCVLVFTNFMLAIVENKTINRIAIFIVYSIFIFGDYCWHLSSTWPYRSLPYFCILNFFYILDILTMRFIVKKLLNKDIL